jgi:transcriptional regulator with XRE-family HTH domain
MSKPIFTESTPLGERLRKLRHWREMTLMELHDKAEVGIGTISDVESGKRQPNTTTLLKLARALGVSLKTLTGL